MAWYNPLSWGEKAVDNVLDSEKGLLAQVGGWVGNMNLTDEEVIKHNAKTIDSVHKFVEATLNESTERSRSRRDFAKLWIKMHVSIIMFCCLSAPWDAELAAVYLNLATSPLIAGITGAISIFFFGSQGLARHNESKQAK